MIGLTNRDLLLPYFVPYFAYVGIASMLANVISIELNYLLRIAVVTPLIFWAWKWYAPISISGQRFLSIAWGVGTGLAGCLLWCLLLAPFIDQAGEGTKPWSTQGFLLRLFAATLLVPLFEEIAIRGYVLRLALQWDQGRKNKVAEPLMEALDRSSLFDVKNGEWTVAAILISSIAFTLGHNTVEWLAAFAYSLLISWLWIKRGDLLSCIVAHGTTNFALALFVFNTGSWGFW
ncbi:MAG: CPBP family intramembrane metalloprotease [Desulfamplus sp.]|nr:CPBP family intramembrane metalloprotease [Desulfamplus sp.]